MSRIEAASRGRILKLGNFPQNFRGRVLSKIATSSKGSNGGGGRGVVTGRAQESILVIVGWMDGRCAVHKGCQLEHRHTAQKTRIS